MDPAGVQQLLRFAFSPPSRKGAPLKQRRLNKESRNKMGVASLVLGIVGLILSFIPCVGWIALALTIPGVILGAIGISAAKKSGQGKGISVAGLVCSLLATIFAVIWMLLIAGATSATASAIDEFAKEAEKAAKRQAERAEQNRWNSGSEDFERELKRESEKLQKELDSKMDELLNNL